ncbi:MAG TPA: monovalent cation/H(+) antiporter subunit G [Sulfurovum sp.]|uniref:cation:proton antiporter n=1 Tax=Sulfurovum sp. TaxID=1969726 RepID=UPI002F95DED0
MLSEIVAVIGDVFLVLGTVFFIIGTIGVVRFFDLYTRLHALAKIDNMGLGFIALGMILHSGSVLIALKIFLIWVLVLLSSSTLSYILSSHSNETGEEPRTGAKP